VTAIHQVLEQYRAAVFNKDVAAFASLYDDDVRVFDMWGTWQQRGLAAWRQAAAQWFASLGDERVVVDFDDVYITAGADLAVVQAFVTFSAQAADGHTLRSLNNRLTAMLLARDGGWKIVHEHTSAPADFDSGRLMLRR
jgi:uncharacterized protein (TIGR02246 family)